MSEFETEAELCRVFAETVPSAWTVYNETAGFDMLLVHETGFQIGVEAKLRLNAKVVLQAADTCYRRGLGAGPDARAVLVPAGHNNSDLARLCKLLAITVVTVRHTSAWRRKGDGEWSIEPLLPKAQRVHGVDGKCDTNMSPFWKNDRWFDLCPVEQAALPEYLPDVPAGTPSPVVLGRWKIQAIKVCIWVERHGAITRQHFKALGIDPSRWMTGHWLKKGAVRGEWVAGPGFPLEQFRAVHPTIVDQIDADFGTWSIENGLNALGPVAGRAPVEQEAML